MLKSRWTNFSLSSRFVDEHELDGDVGRDGDEARCWHNDRYHKGTLLDQFYGYRAKVLDQCFPTFFGSRHPY